MAGQIDSIVGQEAFDQVKKLEDRLKDLKGTFDNVKGSLNINVGDADLKTLIELEKKLKDVSTEVNKLETNSKKTTSANNEATDAYNKLAQAVEKAKKEARETAAQLDELKKSGNASANEMSSLEQKATKASQVYNKLANDLKVVNNLEAANVLALKNTKAQMEAATKASIAYSDAEEKIAQTSSNLVQKALVGEEKVTRDVIRAKNDLEAQLKSAEAISEKYNRTVLEMVANQTDSGASFDKLVSKANQFESVVTNLKQAVESYNTVQAKSSQLSSLGANYSSAVSASSSAQSDYNLAKQSGTKGNDLEMYANAARVAQAEVARLEKEITSLTREINNEQKAIADNLGTASRSTQETQKQIVENAKLAAQLKTNAQEVARSNSSYDALKKEYAEAALAAKDLSSELFNLKRAGTASNDEIRQMAEVSDRANKKALDLHKGLYNIEQAVGQSHRNVGNYNAVLMETTQLMRELPNFAIDVRTGFMALSNNLPMFADAFGRLAKETDNLTNKPKGFLGALKSMGAAVFSWQGLTIAATTALVMYSDKITAAINKQGAFADSMKKINEQASQNANEQAIRDAQELEFLRQVAESSEQSSKQRVAAAKKIKDSNEELFAQYTTQQIMEGQVGDAYALANERIKGALEQRLLLETAYEYKKLAMQKRLESEKDITGAMDAESFRAYVSGESTKNPFKNPVAQFGANALANASKITGFYGAISQKFYTGLANAYGTYLMGTAEAAVEQADILEKMSDEAVQKASKANIAGRTIDIEKDKKEKKKKKKTYDDDLNQLLANQQRVLAAKKEWAILEADAEAEAQRTLMDNEQATYSQRIEALDQYTNKVKYINAKEVEIELNELEAKQKKIAEIEKRLGKVIDENELDKVKFLKGTTHQERDLLREKFAIREEYGNKTVKLETDNLKVDEQRDRKEREIYQSSTQSLIRALKERYDKIDDEIQSRSKDKVNALTGQYNRGEITYKDYDRRRKSALAGTSLAMYQEQLAEINKMMEEMKDAPVEVQNFIKKLEQSLRYTRQGNKKTNQSFMESVGLGETLNNKIDDAKKNMEAALKVFGEASAEYLAAQEEYIALQSQANDKLNKVLENSIKGLVNSLTTLMETKRNAYFQTRMDQLDAERDKIEQNAEAEKLAVESSILSAEEKEKKLADIAAATTARENQIDKEKKILDREKAAREKEQAKFEAIIGAAKAAMEAIVNSKGNPAKAAIALALIAAMTATQIATINATPLPAYAEGTDNHKGGLAVVGEVGTELGILPSGKTFLTPSTASIMDLPRGTQIIPHDQLSKHVDPNTRIAKENSQNYDGWEYLGRTFREVVTGMPQTTYSMEDGEMTKTVRSRNSKIKYMGKFKK